MALIVPFRRLASEFERAAKNSAWRALGNLVDRNFAEIEQAFQSIGSGMLAMTAATDPPPGWLLCDGAAVSRSVYSGLFGTLGTTYGSGDGSTTFNVPNLKGRFPVGLNAADADFDTLGETGGAKTVTLGTAEMPAHTHTGPSHTHTTATQTSVAEAGGSGLYTGAGRTFEDRPQVTGGSTTTSAAGTGATGSAGSTGAHNNMPPFFAVNYIIKT